MPRAHPGLLGEIVDRQPRVEMLTRPGEQRSEAAGWRLQFEQGGELRLAAAAAVVEHELPRSLLHDLVAVILRHHRKCEIDAGGDAGRAPEIAVTHEDAVRLEPDLR